MAQRIERQLHHPRVHEVQGIAAAGVVDAEAWIVRLQPVVAGIVQSAHRQRRTALAALAGVVVDHVEQHLDVRRMQRADRGLELGGPAAGEIARLGREVAERVVAPVVHQAALHQRPIVHQRVDRQQLDRRDAQLAQKGDGALMAERRGAATQRLGNAGQPHRQPAQMCFVDHGIGPGNTRRAIRAPVELLAGHHALGNPRGTVASVEGQIAAG